MSVWKRRYFTSGTPSQPAECIKAADYGLWLLRPLWLAAEREIERLMLKDTAGPLLRRFVAGFSPRRPGLSPRLVHMGFVVEKVAVGQVFLRVLRFFPVIVILLLLHIHSSIICGMDSAPLPQRDSLIPSQQHKRILKH